MCSNTKKEAAERSAADESRDTEAVSPGNNVATENSLSIVERLAEYAGDNLPAHADIETGSGNWFSELDDCITDVWSSLPFEAKLIACLWGMREYDLYEQSMDYRWDC